MATAEGCDGCLDVVLDFGARCDVSWDGERLGAGRYE